MDCDGSLQHDESYYIEIKTVSLLDGLPLTADFIQKVKESGGRFAGNPMARFLNLKVTAPQPA